MTVARTIASIACLAADPIARGDELHAHFEEALKAAVRHRLRELQIRDPNGAPRRLEVRDCGLRTKSRRAHESEPGGEKDRPERPAAHFFRSPSFSSFNATEFMQ